MLDSLVRVSRRGKENHFASITRANLSPNQGSKSFCPDSNPYWPTLHHSAPVASSRGKMMQNNTGFLCFHFSNFRYSLTLFSKFFSSFPHGTCSLSVSHQYLALDGIYHPIWAAIPNNSTHTCKLKRSAKRESHPLRCPVPRDFGRPITQTHHNSSVRALPASVALTEGILVSFFSSA